MRNAWGQSLIVMQGPGPTLANSAVQTSLLLGQAKYTMPAGFQEFLGVKFRIKAHFKISTKASAPGTLALTLLFGSVAVFAGGASPTLATSASNLTGDLELDIVTATIGDGTLATVTCEGKLISAALSATTPIQLLPASSPGPGAGYDSTSSFKVDLQATWSVADPLNSITCTGYELISLN